jgi:hypothetical protein
VLGGATVKQLVELSGQHLSIRAIARRLKHNFWPAVEFHDGADLNRQAHTWMEHVANVRLHGTTGERPLDRFAREAPEQLHRFEARPRPGEQCRHAFA